MGDVETGPAASGSNASPSDGYPFVADLIARDPDNETFVFRKFNKLTARLLLYQQAELQVLERDLDKLDRSIAQQSEEDDVHLELASRSWVEMQNLAGKQPEGEMGMQVKLTDKIRGKLRTYHEDLLVQAQIAGLTVTSSRVLSALRTEVHGRSQIPGPASKLAPLDRQIFDKERDLVALAPPVYHDRLSQLIRDKWPFTPRPRLPTAETWHYEERNIIWLAGALSTAIATVLLIGSILALYWVTNPDLRLALVLLFIVLFAISLKLCTGASRDHVFTATAAYAAVLVVFVSGNLGNATSS